MKRPSSAPSSYLHQLAAPLPHPAVLLHARHPVTRGVSSVLDAIPHVVDFVDSADSVENSSPRNPSPQTPHAAPPSVLSSVHSTIAAPDVHGKATSLPVIPAPAAARPSAASSDAEDVPQPAAPRSRLRQRSAAPQPSTRLDPEPASRLSTASLRPSLAEPSSPRLASPSAPYAEAKRSRGVQVHIGTVEVRLAAPPSLPPPPANRHRDPIPSHTGRPAHAEPLSRGLAWSHGLVQG